MKNLYKKIAPVISKIALIGLILGVLAFLGGKFYISGLEAEQAWELYYASWVVMIGTYLLIAFAAVYVLFTWCTLWPALKERVRKFVVSLKRNPSTIPLVMMFVTFLYYSLNLTDVSNTTAYIFGKGMGLCQFCIMLFSLLSLVCMLNAFPRRKKPNIPMILLLFGMFGIIVYCDIYYCNLITAAVSLAESTISLEGQDQVVNAFNMLNIHKVLTIVSAVLVALLPVYSKLLRKIKTSVVVEDNGEMGAIELQD